MMTAMEADAAWGALQQGTGESHDHGNKSFNADQMRGEAKLIMPVILTVALYLLAGLSSYAATTYCNPINLNYAYQVGGTGADHPNPLVPFREAADPSVTIFNNQYFLFASKSWGYWYSSDLLNWTYVPVTAAQLPAINSFAPTVVTLDGYIYYKANGSDYIYRSSNPKDANSWTAVPNTNYLFAAGSSTDAQFFYDSDTDRLFVTSGSSSSPTMYIQELDRQTFLVKGNYQFAASDYRTRGFERPSGQNGNNDGGESSGWTEGSQMLKYNGKYYYIYSLPDLGNGYCNGVLIGTNPMGPFTFQPYSPFAQKFKGFANGAGHGQVFQDLYGNWWNITCQDIWVLDRYERRLSLFPTGFCPDGQINSDTLFGDYPTKIISAARGNPLDSQLTGWRLLSKGKPATASSTLSGSSVSKAFDEDIRSWWSATTGNSGEWLQVDLQSQCTVNALQVNFAEQDLVNTTPGIKYKVEMSNDGSTWTPLVDKWNSTTDLPHDYIELPSSVTTRYLKLTINQIAFGGKCAVRDFRVFGNAGGSAPALPGSFSVTRDSSDGRNATVSWSPVGNADGYVIRYGVAPDRLFHSYQLYNTTSWPVRSLNASAGYYFTVDTFNSSGYSQNTAIQSIAAPLSSTPTVATVAASYNSQSGVQTENCVEGGLDVSNIQNGSYTVYNNVNLNGVNSFTARVSSAGAGGSIQIRMDSPSGTLIGTCPVPVTGGWQTWTTQTINTTGASGYHNLYLVYAGGSGYLFNVEWFALLGGGNIIEASSYNSANAVQTENCAEGGLDLGFISNGSYTEYNNVNLNGIVGFQARTASGASGGSIVIHLDSPTGTVIGTHPVSGTGGWQTWTTGTIGVTGASGYHNVYLVYTGGSGNLFNVKSFAFTGVFGATEAASYNTMSAVGLETCSEGGQDVANISNGSYTEYNNVNLNGSTFFAARTASAGAGGNIVIHLDSPAGAVIGTCPVPATGGWQTWTTQTIGVTGASGSHNVYLVYTGGSGILFNVKWFVFNGTFGATEASNYNSMSAVGLEPCSEGGQDVANISNGSYVEYNNVNLNGATSFAARVASAGAGGNIQICLDSPTGTVIGTCPVPVTGGWQTWTTQSCNLSSGTSGTHNIYLIFTGGSGALFNVKSFAFNGISGATEAAGYNTMSAIGLETCSEGGQDVTNISNGSYTEYNNFNLNGVISFAARTASAGAGGNIVIHLDSPAGAVIGTCPVPVTGGWQTWTTQTIGVTGASGYHNVYLVYTGASGNLFNVKWLGFQANIPPPTPTPAPVPPAAPTRATVAYLSPNEVDLLWTDNATDETGYKVLRRINSANFVQIGTLPPGSTSFKDTTVQPSTSYDYRIQAYNAVSSDFAGLSVTTPAQSQYYAYFAGFGMTDPTLSDPAADPDSDGIPNLLEYAFNLNPTQSNASGLPVTAMQNGYLTISFVQRTPPTDINYSVQVSDDLLNWNSGAAYTTPISITPIDASTQSVIMRDNVPIDTASKRFIRVNVTR